MAGKAEYRSAKRSRKLIREAFLTLLKTKEYCKITVTDVVTLADINRATFYAHYPDIRGLMDEIENEIITKMKDVLSGFEFGSFFQNPTPLLLQINRYLEEDEDFYRTLILSNAADQFLEKLKGSFTDYMMESAHIPENVRASKVFELCVCYFAGGMINMYLQWFRGCLDCSLNDISVQVGKMIAMTATDIFLCDLPHNN